MYRSIFQGRLPLCREHALEMGGNPDKDPPFFFTKPPDAAVDVSAAGATMHYPPETQDLQHEVEMVVAIGRGECHLLLSYYCAVRKAQESDMMESFVKLALYYVCLFVCVCVVTSHRSFLSLVSIQSSTSKFPGIEICHCTVLTTVGSCPRALLPVVHSE